MNDRLVELVKAFEDFEKGVQLLEGFGLEVKNLNIAGFEKDAEEIRAKLNDVDEIPFIKTSLKELKRRVNIKEKMKREKPEESKIEKEYKKEGFGSLKMDVERLEEYGFKVKGVVKFKK